MTIEKRPPQTQVKPAATRPPSGPKAPFVAQRPSLAKQAPRRMPKAEDFPPVAQKELKARSGGQPETGLEAQKKKIGFFERLTGRRAKPQEPEIVRDKEPDVEAPKQAMAALEPQPAARHAASGQPPTTRTQITRKAGTPKPSTGQVAMQDEEEDLEIPAFLKRQVN